MLTGKQSRIMRVVQDMVDVGDKPTYRSIQERLGYRSVNSVFNIIGTIVEKGYLSKNPRDGTITVQRRLESEAVGEPRSNDPLILFIHRHQIEHDGASPSFREIAKGVDVKSFRALHHRMKELIQAGDLDVLPTGNKGQRAGALRVVKK